MKFAVVLLALLPFAFSLSVEERSILGHLGFPHMFNIDFIKNNVQLILNDLGSNISEQQCEQDCHTILRLDESHLIHNICYPLCRSFQKLVNLFGLRPQPQTTQFPVGN